MYLTAAVTEQVIYAFVTSRFGVGNALVYRLPLKQIQRFQKAQKWAARLKDWRYEIQPCYTAADKVALAVDSSAGGIQNPATHSSSTDWPALEHTEQCVSLRQPGLFGRSGEQHVLCVPRTSRHCSDRAFNVAASPKSVDCVTAASGININHCCV